MRLSKKRLAELSTIQQTSLYNQVYPLQKVDYAREVTEASNKAFVLVHLTSSSSANVESRILTELWRQLAAKYGDIKFCEIRGDMCIEGYPDRNTPTILVYKDGEIRQQLITLKELRGPRTKIEGSPSIPVAVKRGRGFQIYTDAGQIWSECSWTLVLSKKATSV